jgi:hypothetical protein
MPYFDKFLDLYVRRGTDVDELVIGAGANIIQHIERDYNDPRIWDVANSKILNIQLIDSTAFKLVTGEEPLESPITPYTYKELGLPFYQLWRNEDEGDGVAGQWGAIAGVKAVASKNMKQKQISKSSFSEVETPPSGETDSLSGLDPSFNFPVVMLDVDASLPKFKSVADEDRTEGWEDCEEGW